MRATLLLLTATLLSTHASGCGSAQSRPEDGLAALPPPSLLPADALGRDIFLRQRVVAEWPSGETQFEAIVQKEDDRLQVFGLSPAGQVGFIFTLEGGEVHVENRAGRTLPFSPAWILADVQRAYYPSEALQGGDLELIETLAEDGLPARRVFQRAGERVIVIEYGPAEGRAIAPEKVRLENLEYDYRLLIETFEETFLDG